MNKYLKQVLIERLGCHKIAVDCGSMCNGFDYKIGRKYVTTWHVDVVGRKQNVKRVVITPAVAQHLATDITSTNWDDARRCESVVNTVRYFFEHYTGMHRTLKYLV